MTTNGEWLFSKPFEEQVAWMNAEHAESPTSATMQHIGQVIEDTVKRGVYGDTDEQNEDSREQLEAEIRYEYNGAILTEADEIIAWLDRQAAITAEETSNAWEEYRDAAQREIAELTAERDELQAAFDAICISPSINATGKPSVISKLVITVIETLATERNTANRKCNEYREKFGKCLDYADAIHALMDDEGMA